MKPRLILYICLGLFFAAAGYVVWKNQAPSQLHAGDSGSEKEIAAIVSRLSLAEKIGQMVLVDKNVISSEDAGRKTVGAVLSGGGGNPPINTPDHWYTMVKAYQEAALGSQSGIPILYGVDAVHGHGNVEGAVIFPHNIGLGATRDADLVEETARITGEEMKATGANWNFAPVLSVPDDMRWGRVYECFGTDIRLVTEMGRRYQRGIQKAGVLATPKHFIGEGAETWQTSKDYKLDQGDIPQDASVVTNRYLEPFKQAVEEGAMSIMVSRSSIQGKKVSADKELLTGVLKDQLGFKGFLVSDWGAVDQISDDYYDDIATAINAGMDMVMLPADYDTFISNITYAVNNGDIPQSRIDDAVTRILRAKQSINLFKAPLLDPYQGPIVGSDEHRAVARRAVRESLVLLKNDNQALPIQQPKKILVVGRAADDIGMQAGGWTIQWQGTHGDATPGTSILTAVREQFSDSEIIYNPMADRADVKKADVAIVVIGEQPYAEGAGDRDSLELSPEDTKRIMKARSSADKTILLVLAGRPLIITDMLANVDAAVMAWLPGTEGGGITDVLSGRENFSGKLPLAWPRSMEQVEKRDTSDPLFAYGYGLSY